MVLLTKIMINQVMCAEQLSQILRLTVGGQRVTVMRIIRHCGRSRVPWIYFAVGSQLRATFVSFTDLIRAYYRWLCDVDLMRIKLEERKAIGRANFLLLFVGDAVFHAMRVDNKVGEIVEMALNSQRLPTVWVDWGNGTPMPELPWFLEKF